MRRLLPENINLTLDGFFVAIFLISIGAIPVFLLLFALNTAPKNVPKKQISTQTKRMLKSKRRVFRWNTLVFIGAFVIFFAVFILALTHGDVKENVVLSFSIGALAWFGVIVRQTSPAYLINRGVKNLNNGNFKSAQKLFNRVLRIDSNNFLGYLNRGISRFNLGDKGGALKDFDESLSINPEYVQTLINRGNLKKEIGDSKGALNDYTKLINIEPENANN